MRCEILPPNHSHLMDSATGCPLPVGHTGPHRTETPRLGLVEWGDDDCDCCAPEEADRCIWYGRLAGPEKNHAGG
jgi:hypothetical protein